MSPEGLLGSVRHDIAEIDRAIIELMSQRVRLGSAVAEAKRAAGQPVLDPAQEATVVRRAAELARRASLPEEGVRDIFWRLIAITRGGQERSA